MRLFPFALRTSLSLLIVGLSACAAHAATLRGIVTDATTSEPLAVVNVVAIRLDGPDRRGISSGNDGSYSIPDLSVGRYEVVATRIGYFSISDTVRVSEPSTRLDFVLDEDAIPIEGVDVTGDRFKQERETQTGFVDFDQEVIKTLPSIGDPDPIRSLQLLPGVQAASDISSGLYIRGGGPDQTLVTLDGVPIYNPTHAFGFFSTFNADALDGVTLYKGAYPAEYGGRLGAVVDVRSKDPEGPVVKGQAGLSTITGRLLLEGPLGDDGNRGGWMVSGRRTFLEPFLDAIRTEDNEIPSYYFYDFNGKLQVHSGESGRWEVSFYNGSDNLNFDLEEDSFIRLGWGNTSFSASYSQIFATSLLGKLQLSTSEYTSETKVQIFTTPFGVENRLFDISLRGDLTWEATPSHRLRTGFVLSRYDFRYKQSFNREEQIDFEKSPSDVSAFFQDEWRPKEDLHIQPGIRLRYFSDGDRFLVEPRLSISDRLTDTTRWKFGAGLYNQYLQLISTEGFAAGDFYVPIDETTRPSRSTQGVVGLTWEPTLEYEFSAETYFTDLDNLVLFDKNAPQGQNSLTAEDLFVTGGTGWASGLELFAQKRTGALTGWVGYTLGWTRRTFEDVNEGEAFPPKYDRRHDINTVASYRKGPWTYSASYVYGTGQAFTPASSLYTIRNPAENDGQSDVLILPGEKNSARLYPYNRLDIGVTRDFSMFGREAKWLFQVFNVYSRRNEWFVQYNTSDLSADPEVVKMLPLIPTLGIQFDF